MGVEMLHGQGQVFGWRERFVRKELTSTSALELACIVLCELSDTQ